MHPSTGAQPNEPEIRRRGQANLLGAVEHLGQPRSRPLMLRVTVEDGIHQEVYVGDDHARGAEVTASSSNSSASAFSAVTSMPEPHPGAVHPHDVCRRVRCALGQAPAHCLVHDLLEALALPMLRVADQARHVLIEGHRRPHTVILASNMRAS